jgi:hypothetical protein
MPILEDLYAKQRLKQVELLPFFYSTSITTLVASPSTVPGSIGIQSDSHFLVRYGNIMAYTGAANAQVVAATSPPLLVQFLDTGSGRTLFDNAQPIQNVLGGMAAANAFGNAPFIFPEPWLVRAGGSVTVTLTNIGATTFTRVDVSLIGVKVFRFGGAQPADM